MASGEACQQIVDLSVPASQMIAPLYRTWWGEVFSWVSEAHWAAPGVSYWSHQDRWGHRHYWLGWFNFCILMSWARQYYTLVCFYRKFTNTLLSWIYLMIAFSCWAFFFFFMWNFEYYSLFSVQLLNSEDDDDEQRPLRSLPPSFHHVPNWCACIGINHVEALLLHTSPLHLEPSSSLLQKVRFTFYSHYHQ